MIRKYLCFFLLTSCSTSMTFENLYESVSPFLINSNTIPEKYLNEFPYSYASVRFGRSQNSIVVLSQANQGVLKWVSNDGVQIFTFKGKIIKTIGLPYDIEIPFDQNKLGLTNMGNFTNEVTLKSKGTYVNSVMNVSRFISNEQKIIERFQVKDIKWKGKNIYYLDKTGRVEKSINQINPFAKSIEMNFFKYHKDH